MTFAGCDWVEVGLVRILCVGDRVWDLVRVGISIKIERIAMGRGI
jgi:hypothetical protein